MCNANKVIKDKDAVPASKTMKLCEGIVKRGMRRMRESHMCFETLIRELGECRTKKLNKQLDILSKYNRCGIMFVMGTVRLNNKRAEFSIIHLDKKRDMLCRIGMYIDKAGVNCTKETLYISSHALARVIFRSNANTLSDAVWEIIKCNDTLIGACRDIKESLYGAPCYHNTTNGVGILIDTGEYNDTPTYVTWINKSQATSDQLRSNYNLFELSYKRGGAEGLRNIMLNVLSQKTIYSLWTGDHTEYVATFEEWTVDWTATIDQLITDVGERAIDLPESPSDLYAYGLHKNTFTIKDI